MFYLRLAYERTQRLLQKYRDARDATGSRLQGGYFIAQFCRQRFGYLLRHLRARSYIRSVRMEVQASRPHDRPCLALKVTGGIGDYIVIARYLRDLAREVEPFAFDIYCNNIEVAEWVFAAVPGFREAFTEFLFEDLMREYDIGLWIMQAIIVHRKTAAWHRLRASRRLCAALQHIARFKPKIEPFIGRHPMMDNFLAQRAVYMNFTRSTFLQGMTGIPPEGDALDLAVDESIFSATGLHPGRYITIQSGFDPGMVVRGIGSNTATKCYPRFAEVVRHIKSELPDLTIVQVGAGATSTPIAGVDRSLVGETTIQQTAALLKHAAWHIDNEGGLVHLGRCFGTRSTVVFGPTPIDFFAYEGNVNIRPASCGGCWWITETWMARCPRGHLAPLCTRQDPVAVARATIDAICPHPARIVAASEASSA
ncbi:MAG TPA: glycosyltransferase family 9 protein [Acetobacteraceae bacterium]|nr:glycosyltransferase family 9 protein [Acetobacteraceae bacterium]